MTAHPLTHNLAWPSVPERPLSAAQETHLASDVSIKKTSLAR